MLTLRPSTLLTSVDLPTLGRPTRATNPDRKPGGVSRKPEPAGWSTSGCVAGRPTSGCVAGSSTSERGSSGNMAVPFSRRGTGIPAKHEPILSGAVEVGHLLYDLESEAQVEVERDRAVGAGGQHQSGAVTPQDLGAHGAQEFAAKALPLEVRPHVESQHPEHPRLVHHPHQLTRSSH